ncbi:MAG: MBL fold metallo-hydrolase [Isosphaeraceae bacterium]|nr:MBL fold metallo-hydrolase [Isosphaeraceae bacterium]
MRITFHGAARQVTGSAHLLEVGRYRILLDCGLFDSDRVSPDSPNRHFTFEPTELDAVIVSHAHNDHIGRLPCLMRAGYDGPVYTTRATADILNVMLRDSARIQREDARTFALRKTNEDLRTPAPAIAAHAEPPGPLFELHDVEWLIENLRRLPYGEPIEILDGVSLTFLDAGHILGSALVQLDVVEDGRERRLLFTGDLGRRSMGLLPDPTIVKNIDILISESTYGNKELDPYDKLIKQLHAIVARATRLQSKIVIPAFSLGRTQRMVYCFQELFTVHKVRPIPVYVDSPLALRLTDIYREYPEAYTPFARRMMEADGQLFNSPHITFCASWDESRRLNHLSGPLVIIASSGMCEAGRIRHHLRHTVEDPDNAIVIVSYQAEGTLGRQLAEGVERVQIFDQWHDLNAAVYVLDGFSGHADRNDLAWWYEQTGGGIDRAFLVHGEPESMLALAPVLQPYVKHEVCLPETLGTYEF